METISPEDTLNANPGSVKSEDSSPQPESGRGSPPPNCAICLGTCRNKSFTDSCLHQFCFNCLLTWSKVKAECPLCKQVFKSIIHNVRSNDQYEEYMVEQRVESTMERIDIDDLVLEGPRRFRYRTTLTLPRSESAVIHQLLSRYNVFSTRLPSLQRRSPTSFRRTVYRHNLWARPLPDFTGRFRDCTPEFYRYNDAQMPRLVPWLNRELHYLLNENAPHIAYVLGRIMQLLPEVAINSTEFRNAMQCYFGDRTEHFLHELYCFASTPYDMTGYDRHVQYSTDQRISTAVNEVLSSSDSSADSDIMEVTSADPTAGPSRAPPRPAPYLAAPVVPIETISHSDTDDDDDVMVVGYIKPPQERTPEVVDLLGSDSDVMVQDGPAADTADTADAAPLVKVRLKQSAPPAQPDSDSDAALATAPAPAYPRAQILHPRRSRRVQAERSSSADTWRPSPTSTPSASSSSNTDSSTSPSVSSTTSPSTSCPTTDSCDSSVESAARSEPVQKRRKVTKKRKRTLSKTSSLPPRKDKSKSKRKSQSNRPRKTKDSERNKEKKSNSTLGKDKRSKQKSRSKKDVKSSKKSQSNNSSKVVPADSQPQNDEVETSMPEELARDQPSTSGIQTTQNTADVAGGSKNTDRDDSRERRRLRSVVKVMNQAASSSSEPNLEEKHIKRQLCSCGSETCPRKRLYASIDVELTERLSSIADQDSDSDNSPLDLSLNESYIVTD